MINSVITQIVLDLDVRAQAMRWQDEDGLTNKSSHVPTFCAVQNELLVKSIPSTASQPATLSFIVQKQQEQLDQITKT